MGLILKDMTYMMLPIFAASILAVFLSCTIPMMIIFELSFFDALAFVINSVFNEGE